MGWLSLHNFKVIWSVITKVILLEPMEHEMYSTRSRTLKKGLLAASVNIIYYHDFTLDKDFTPFGTRTIE